MKFELENRVCFKTPDGELFESRFDAEHYMVEKILTEKAGEIYGDVAGSRADPTEVMGFLEDNKELILKYLENKE